MARHTSDKTAIDMIQAEHLRELLSDAYGLLSARNAVSLRVREFRDMSAIHGMVLNLKGDIPPVEKRLDNVLMAVIDRQTEVTYLLGVLDEALTIATSFACRSAEQPPSEALAPMQALAEEYAQAAPSAAEAWHAIQEAAQAAIVPQPSPALTELVIPPAKPPKPVKLRKAGAPQPKIEPIPYVGTTQQLARERARIRRQVSEWLRAFPHSTMYEIQAGLRQLESTIDTKLVYEATKTLANRGALATKRIAYNPDRTSARVATNGYLFEYALASDGE